MMTRQPFALCMALLGLTLASPAVAAERHFGERVFTEGPYTIREQMSKDRLAAAQVEQVSITKSVSYADLDLSRPSQVEVLKGRMALAARDSCNKLRRSYPGHAQGLRQQDCIANAVRPAYARIDRTALASR